MKTQNIFAYPLLALGFRVFFLLAGLSALLLIGMWNALLRHGWTGGHYFSANDWHAHEMLLGYTVAVLAGYALTAVKTFTGHSSLRGERLFGLCLLWLYGRILPFYAGLLPNALIAAVDWVFLPTLVYLIAKPMWVTHRPQLVSLATPLLLLAVGNALIHAQALGLATETAALGFKTVLATLVLGIIAVAGRIMPYFTERAISGTLILKNPVLEITAIASAALALVLYLAGGEGAVLAWPAALAALANLARLVSWYVPRVRFVPLLWVLYLGYGWLAVGFGLLALTAYQLLPLALALHAFAVGGMAVLTLGMMARLALGQTGRALRVPNAMALAFVLINAAAVLRVLLPIVLPNWYDGLVYTSVLCWLAAFALFAWAYFPVLAQARIDSLDD